MDKTPFFLPFRRDERFVGRISELKRLHTALQQARMVCVRPDRDAGGGGMGVSALAIEYAYRHREEYPGGVLGIVFPTHRDRRSHHRNWLDALDVHMPVQDSRRRARGRTDASGYLAEHSDALLVVAGLSAVEELQTTAGFKCRVVFTVDRYHLTMSHPAVDVGPLPKPAAFTLLGVLADRDRAATAALVEAIGGMPLALRIVAAALTERPELRIADALGALADEDGQVSRKAALRAAFRFCWAALADPDARTILQILSLLPARASAPLARLANLTGLELGGSGPLELAASTLLRRKLVEEHIGGGLSMHPRIAELVEETIDDPGALVLGCEGQLAPRLRDLEWLEREVLSRGVGALLGDVSMVESALHRVRASGQRQTDYRPVVDLLRAATSPSIDPPPTATFFLQQLAYADAIAEERYSRSTNLGALAVARLAERNEPSWSPRRPVGEEKENGAGPYVAAAMCAGGCHAMTVRGDGEVVIWDSSHMERLHGISLNASIYRACALATEGLVVVATTNDGIELWDLADGSSLGAIPAQSAIDLAITPDGRFLACLHSDREAPTLSHYDLRKPGPPRQTRLTGERSLELRRLRHDRPGQLAISPDGERVMMADAGGGLWVWEPAGDRGAHRHKPELGSGEEPTGRMDGAFDPMTEDAFLALSSDGRVAFSTTADGSLFTWLIGSPVRGRLLARELGKVRGLATAAKGDWVVAVASSILIWNCVSGRLTASLPDNDLGSSRERTPCLMSPDGRLIIVQRSYPLFLTRT